MARFLLRRLAGTLLTLWLASAVVFVALDLLPGNAAQVMLGETATPQAVQALERRLGLDRPPLERYLGWLQGLLRGELGVAVSYEAPVAELLRERMAVTLPLAALAMAATTLLALGLGVYAASRHGRLGDVGVMAASQLGIALPSFWLAILLVLLFSVQLQWFPAGGFPGWTEDAGGGLLEGLRALLLPALALALVQAAILARITRAAVLEVLREDFVRTARSRGLSPRQVLWRHVLRNALLPVLTVMGLQFANLLTGTVVIENVFSLPGLGRLSFQAIANRDLVLLRNLVMLLAALVIAVNLLVDLAQAAVDPRLRARG
ncbi:ABC transporter permease [Piscinibacter sakaiensis]|uniref:ABC transporter permease n=1 Tax=Piscinibacter sakaiensis TaxID=1547922 RepID=UPI0006B630D1|nr:ABC transporter permease [Piscinibacter sakaiensis]